MVKNSRVASSGIQFLITEFLSFTPWKPLYQRRVGTALPFLLSFSSVLFSSHLLNPSIIFPVNLFPSFTSTFPDLFLLIFLHHSTDYTSLHPSPGLAFLRIRTTYNDRILLQDDIQDYRVDYLVIGSSLDSLVTAPSGSAILVDASIEPVRIPHILFSPCSNMVPALTYLTFVWFFLLYFDKVGPRYYHRHRGHIITGNGHGGAAGLPTWA